MITAPNVRKLNNLPTVGGPQSRVSQQADGTWAAVPASGPASEAEISRDATAEEAAAVRVAKLESEGVWVPEPPDDYLAGD